MFLGVVSTVAFLASQMANGNWELEDTKQGTGVTASEIVTRGRRRGRVASLLTALTYSLSVNASLDKFGLIDPSTSTVLVGMTIGGTWGFMLDMMLGTDEGFREYLWSAPRGMAYAFGSLATARYLRFIVTILFDMFFTVILFKQLYPRLVLLAGFTVKGREWVANGFCSAFISVITFQVCMPRRRAGHAGGTAASSRTARERGRGPSTADPLPVADPRLFSRAAQVYGNMTRFQWAYPSGGDADELSLGGPVMVLAAVMMNMVYLVIETRTRVGEPGINDPNVKIPVTAATFLILVILIESDHIEARLPANVAEAFMNNGTLDPANDVHLPLYRVCETLHASGLGVLIFSGLVLFCLGFVIFVTSAQSLSGLRHMCPCCCRSADADADAALRANAQARLSVRNPDPVSEDNQALPMSAPKDGADQLKGKFALLVIYLLIVLLLVAWFGYVPMYQADLAIHGARNDSLWREACDNLDIELLAGFGLS